MNTSDSVLYHKLEYTRLKIEEAQRWLGMATLSEQRTVQVINGIELALVALQDALDIIRTENDDREEAFYDRSNREQVMISRSSIEKVSFRTNGGRIRYGLRGRTPDGRYYTKFVTKMEWEEFPEKGKP